MSKKPTLHPSSGAANQPLGKKTKTPTKRDVVKDYAQQALAQIALWEERGEVVPLGDVKTAIRAIQDTSATLADLAQQVVTLEQALEDARKNVKDKTGVGSPRYVVETIQEDIERNAENDDWYRQSYTSRFSQEELDIYHKYDRDLTDEYRAYEQRYFFSLGLYGLFADEPREKLTFTEGLYDDTRKYYAELKSAKEEEGRTEKQLGAKKQERTKARKAAGSLEKDAPNMLQRLNPILEQSDHAASTALINAELAKYAADNGTDVGAMAEALPVRFTQLITGQFTIGTIEQLLEISTSETNTPEERALKQFVNHAMIPSLQYYVIRGAINQLAQADGKALAVSAQDYPNIRKHSHEMTDLRKALEVQPRVDALTEPAVDFSDLMNSSTGSHLERMEKALKRTDKLTKQYEKKFGELQARLKHVSEIKIPDLDKAIEDMTAASDKRRGQLEHSLSLADMRSKAMGTAIEKTYGNKDGGYQFGRVATYIAPAIDAGATALGFPTFGAATHTIHRITDVERYNDDVRGKLRAKFQKAYNEAHEAVIKGELNKLSNEDKRIAVMANELVKLEEELGINQTEQGQVRDAAISEALIAKYVLSFGMHMSSALESTAQDAGFDSIDSYLEALEATDRRLGEAVSNLAYGFADSNDITVLLAEVNSVGADSPKEVKALAEFAEAVLKPNIADVLSHASKVDVIYQTNLTGLGTPFHATRNSVHDANHARVAALFSDAFGVTSTLQELTTHGATDVKRLFDFYLHRHGNEFISDAKINDGIEKMPKTEKAVSTLPHRELRHHIESTKAAQGYRREAPDISDMFVRICAFEYVYPQAPNVAAKGNVMTETPAGPAAYVMVNKVVNDFVERLSNGPIEQYREQVGPELDALLAQTFIDFFQETGRQHAADQGITDKKRALHTASKETSTHGFAFDDFCRHVTSGTANQFDTFLEIYARNLEKTLETAPREVAEALEAQIEAIDSELKETLKAPKITRPNTHSAREKARDGNHTLENVSWRGGETGRALAV